MKYQNLNNSCFFAALANLFEDKGVDIEDVELISNSILGNLFCYDECSSSYYAGMMIQRVEVINMILSKYGMVFSERVYDSKSEAVAFLSNGKKVIVSIMSNENRGHACILEKVESGLFHFTNMRTKDSKETDFELTESELMNRLKEDNIHIGWINEGTSNVEIAPLISQSVNNLKRFKSDILEISNFTLSEAKLKRYRETHFRALFIDLYTIHNEVKSPYLKTLKKDRNDYLKTLKLKNIKLNEYINVNRICSFLDELIIENINMLGGKK